ncbi:MAG: hypothetical protein E5W65_25655 [Mesorhizobium sp.]|uniref:hypothetical protein n=1 Tax=Mesorhizobium sp. TaxID=1871066 RepID=UPI0012057CDC|nr:hypothetical protein [Mesorhizobium sp.]TIT32297.1 MAG: hypothetical protein E5W65_25655 [Mesorhizobium sp.]
MDELSLTKKAEAYVAKEENISSLLTLQIDRTSRKSLAGSIEALIDMLDDLSPDPDLEDGADLEPSLGWGERGPRCMFTFQDGRGSPHDDRELECEDEGAQCEDEGAQCDDEGADTGDAEPWLGWGNATAQNSVGVESLQDVEDSPDYGAAGNFTGSGCNEARQLLRGRRRKEPSLTIVGPAIAIANWHGIKPTDPDQMDARAHYWAAKGF